MQQFTYRVVWECVVEQWLGVRRMLSNERLAMGCVEGYLLLVWIIPGEVTCSCPHSTGISQAQHSES